MMNAIVTIKLTTQELRTVERALETALKTWLTDVANSHADDLAGIREDIVRLQALRAKL